MINVTRQEPHLEVLLNKLVRFNGSHIIRDTDDDLHELADVEKELDMCAIPFVCAIDVDGVLIFIPDIEPTTHEDEVKHEQLKSLLKDLTDTQSEW
jgi:hypothetical protein